MELAIGSIMNEIFSSYSNTLILIISTICLETKNSWLGRLVEDLLSTGPSLFSFKTLPFKVMN